MNLLCSPHTDDESLFCAFTITREAPVVAILTDSWIQPNRGEIGCSADERFSESVMACEILGASRLIRCGIRDDMASPAGIRAALEDLQALHPDVVYAPAIQGGNEIHDWVGRAAHQVFGNIVKPYTTYTRTELYTIGNIEIVPTERELELKRRALDCYQSQWRINRPHFEAVLGKSEWLM